MHQSLSQWFSHHWLLIISLVMGTFITLPLMAPVFMRMGWEFPARLIYLLYSFFCHQLPQRSYFLFGSKFTYSIPEIQASWQNSLNPIVMRQFIGNSEMGWKVAWSDRMVSMYISIWLFGILWWPARKRIKRINWWVFVLFLLPMAIDGFSHLVSDLFGIGQGFRDSNNWLTILTNNSFSRSFYTGDAWGSFNSMMRLLTGILFGIGIVWFGYPYLDTAFSPKAGNLESKPDSTQLGKVEIGSSTSSGKRTP